MAIRSRLDKDKTFPRHVPTDAVSVAIMPAIYRSAFWGIPESAPASAFGVLFGSSQKVPRRVPPRVPGKLGVPQGVLPRVHFLIHFFKRKHSREHSLRHSQFSGHSRGHSPGTFWELPKSTLKALAGALSGMPHKALLKMAGRIAM